APSGGDVDRPVDDQWRAFLAACRVEIGGPGEAERPDSVGTDLIERAVALLGIVAAVSDPVGRVGRGIGQPRRVDATCGFASIASAQRQRQATGQQPLRTSHVPSQGFLYAPLTIALRVRSSVAALAQWPLNLATNAPIRAPSA